MFSRRRTYLLLLFVGVSVCPAHQALVGEARANDQQTEYLQVRSAHASSSQDSYLAAGATDGNRFATSAGNLWKGAAGAGHWEWTAEFGEPKQIGSILQVLGDHETFLAAAPLSYVWQTSDDGTTWRDLESTKVSSEHRMFRVLRFDRPVSARYLRLSITKTGGEPPALREVEFYSDPDQAISFPDWVFIVNSEDAVTPETHKKYLPLARNCPGWGDLVAQSLWHGDFDMAAVTDEPRPMCAFFTGSHRDWCEIDRLSWRGVEAVLKDNTLPMWGACGGGQVFGILAEHGCEQPWDCPKCRDPAHPKSPIYGHIGLIDPTKPTPCGIYTNNIYEKGPTPVRRVVDDPAFRGLPDEFELVEYHCGQLEFLPAGWDLIVTKGIGGKTWMQCMRKRGTCIYAVQFHIENQGTPENSRLIMSNYLALVKQWWKDRAADGTASPRNDSGTSCNAQSAKNGQALGAN
jgi:F5/8 type C domain/Glutamine amidotransferase class-I